MKNKSNSEFESSRAKKIKVEKKATGTKKVTKSEKVVKSNESKTSDTSPKKFDKSTKSPIGKTSKFSKPTKPLSKPKNLGDKGKFSKNNQLEKVEDWREFKKKKKDLKVKRKQTKQGFDVIVQAKKIGEELRRKVLKGGDEKRNQLINELHNLLKSKGHYPKFVLAHDTARLVQWLLKYASPIVIQQISKEIIPQTVDMMQSKYGIFCVKRLLKYGTSEVRSQVIDAMQGNAVKLASHSVSAPVLEYAFSTWATPKQKQLLVQEFYGDLFKNSKDNSIKCLRDVYIKNESLKAATLGATKANLMRILNKSLLDSGLVQTVLNQYLCECSEDDKKELISQLASHIVVISNSKDGARAAMQCIWHGSNKDRKVIVKALKEHLIDLTKHEHGHCVIICLLDTADDTVLLQKVILSEILKNAKDLAVTEWGRKVLLWLVAPDDTTKFHPVFVKELTDGRNASTSKKPVEQRRKEILNYSISTLMELVSDDANFWLSSASLAVEMSAIVKAGLPEQLEKTYRSIVDVSLDPEWKVTDNGKEIPGIEHAGLHMVLKKLAQNDKVNIENGNVTFGSCLVESLTSDILKQWVKLNRGCFILIAVFENGTEDTQNELKSKLEKHLKRLKTETSPGAKILLKKLEFC